MKIIFWEVPVVLFLSAFVAAAQPPTPQPVTDLVIQVSENLNDIIITWSRPQYADGFQVHTGDSSDFRIGETTLIGKTPDTTFTHVNGLIGTEKRFYAVIAISSMVLVPAGVYDMGANYQSPISLPIHTVDVPAFFIDIYEVTNAEYKVFCDATDQEYPQDPAFGGMPNYFANPVYASYPVVMVNWYDAREYAAWVGKRLPTEAEWERAAKGSMDNRQWPWGDTWVAANANVYCNPDDSCDYTAPVGSYPNGVSPAGCYDMAGNVWEWCEDDYHDNYDDAPTDGSAWIDTPRGENRVGRSDAYVNSYLTVRCACRYWQLPTAGGRSIGFRCAKTP